MHQILYTSSILQIKYSFSFLQCPFIYEKLDEKTDETLVHSNLTPLPALNVSRACVIDFILNR